MIYGAAADHNGHDDDDNARHDDGDDDDSRSRPRSNSPCDRPTPTHYSDKSWTVSPQWSSNFEHKTHKTEYSDRLDNTDYKSETITRHAWRTGYM
jgi:hypothetical protein